MKIKFLKPFRLYNAYSDESEGIQQSLMEDSSEPNNN